MKYIVDYTNKQKSHDSLDELRNALFEKNELYQDEDITKTLTISVEDGEETIVEFNEVFPVVSVDSIISQIEEKIEEKELEKSFKKEKQEEVSKEAALKSDVSIELTEEEKRVLETLKKPSEDARLEIRKKLEEEQANREVIQKEKEVKIDLEEKRIKAEEIARIDEELARLEAEVEIEDETEETLFVNEVEEEKPQPARVFPRLKKQRNINLVKPIAPAHQSTEVATPVVYETITLKPIEDFQLRMLKEIEANIENIDRQILVLMEEKHKNEKLKSAITSV